MACLVRYLVRQVESKEKDVKKLEGQSKKAYDAYTAANEKLEGTKKTISKL